MIAAACVVLVIIAVVIYCVHKIIEGITYLSIINKIPGPKPHLILGHILELQGSQEKIFKTLERYNKQYFPIFRLISFNHAAVFISLPEDVEIIISGIKHLEKSLMYTAFHIWLETGLLTSTDEKWHTRRKILTPTFHFNILQQFTLTFIDKSEKLAKELESTVDKEIDITSLITKYTLLTICETAMGTNMDEKKFEKYRKNIYKMGDITVHRVTRPWFYLPLFYMLSPKYYESIFTVKSLHSYSKNIIEQRQKIFNINDIPVGTDDMYRGKKRFAMLDMLLYAKSLGNDIDNDGIREEVDTFMFEGHDTTASCISFTLMLLACNREIQDKVFEELDELLPNEDDKLTFETLNNMKYLERVIKESLRLYPSVPMFGRLTSETVVTHSGYTIPPQTNVLVRVFDMHRNPDVFPNPEKFDPDRFLPEKIKERHPYAYVPFSAGPRNCIGQKFAILEVKAMLSLVMRKFELEPVDTPETITLITDLILHPKNGIRIKFHKRNRQL